VNSSNIGEIVDRLAQCQLSGAEWQIIVATCRRTLRQHNGEWRNQPCPMSLGDLSRVTRLNRRHVAREVKDLVQRNILERIPIGRKYLLSFNLDYSSWVMSKGKPLAKAKPTPQPTPEPTETAPDKELEPAPEPQADLEAEFARRIQEEPSLATFLSRESGRKDDDCLVGEENKNYISEMKAFDDYLRFGTDDEAPKGDTSRRAYLSTAELFTRFLDGRALSPELAKEFIKDLEEKGNRPSSINRYIWALKSYFRFKGKELKIRGLKTTKHYPRYLRDKEWDKLLQTATDTIYNPEASSYARNRAKMELALLYAYGGAGLRLSEAINMTVDDVLDEGFLRVIRKGGREDFVPAEDEVLRGIKDYIEAKGGNGRYVFSGKEKDKPMAPRTAQSIIKDVCRRAGLDDVHVHSLRHTVGYQLRRLGASERDIQDVLGHQNIQTTAIYTHLRDEDLRRKLPKRFSHARQGRLEFPSST